MTLTLDEGHVYRFDGRVVPGVTEIMRPLYSFERIRPEVLQAAADFGQNVHRACELWDKGELDLAALDLELVPYLKSWQGFLDASGATIVTVENRVYHAGHGYAGTLDRRLWWKGDAIVEIKSTALLPATSGPQTAAYAEALGAKKARRYAVLLQPDGSPGRATQFKDSIDFTIFLSCLNLWKWRQKNAA